MDGGPQLLQPGSASAAVQRLLASEEDLTPHRPGHGAPQNLDVGSRSSVSSSTPLSSGLASLQQWWCRLTAAQTRLAHTGSPSQLALSNALAELNSRIHAQLASLEKEAALDPGLTDYHVAQSTRHLSQVLPGVVQAAEAALETQAVGGRLIELLVSSETSWAALEEQSGSSIFHSLSHAVRQPFLACLAQWLAYGELQRPMKPNASAAASSLYSEFMIHESPLARLPVHLLSPSSSSASEAGSLGAAAAEEGHWRRSLLLHLTSEASWHGGYVLQRRDIPLSLLSESSAAIAVAIGKAVAVLRRASASSRNATSGVGDGKDEDSSEEYGIAPSRAAVPAGFSEADSLRLLRLLSTFRGDATTTTSTSSSSSSTGELKRSLELLLVRLRDAVFSRLWQLLITSSSPDGGFMRHAAGMRDHLLLGRGDFYRALLERLPPLARAYPQSACSDSALAHHVSQGPWLQAAALTLNDDGDGESKDRGAGTSSLNYHQHVSVRPVVSAFRWDAATAVAAAETSSASVMSPPHRNGHGGSLLLGPGYHDNDSDEGDDGEEARRRKGRHQQAKKQKAWWEDEDDDEGDDHDDDAGAASSPSSSSSAPMPRLHHSTDQIMAAWAPSHLPGALPSPSLSSSPHQRSSSSSRALLGLPPVSRLRYARSVPGLITVGSASIAATPSTSSTSGLCLAAPAPSSSSSASALTGASSGALWAQDTVYVKKGCLARASVDIAFHRDSTNITASFSLVFQRDGPFALGQAGAAVASSSSPSPGVAVPLGGHEGIANSLALHFLVKPLASSSATGDGGARKFRVVAAAYGPPSRYGSNDDYDGDGDGGGRAVDPASTPDGRALLASGAIMEMALAPSSLSSSSSSATTYRLDVAVELFPRPVASSEVEDAEASEGGAEDGLSLPKGRLFVSVLDRHQLQLGATSTPASTVITTASAAAATRTLIDGAPLDLEGCLTYEASIYRGAGRERAWVGLTAPPPASASPSVSLQAFDFVAYGEPWTSFLPPTTGNGGTASSSSSSAPLRDPLSSFSLHYRAPWPLHPLVLTSSSMSQLEEMGDLLLRTRRAAMALQEVWRSLMAAFSSPPHVQAQQGQGINSARAAGAGGGAATTHRSAAGDGDSASVASGMTMTTTASNADFYGYGPAASRKEREKALQQQQQLRRGGSSSSSMSSTVTSQLNRRSRQDEEAAAQERQERERERALRLERNRALSLSVRVHHGLLRPLWLLRARMSHLVDSLVSFWQSDVVESGFSELRASVEAAPNYLALVRAHDRYVEGLRAGMFYSQPSLLGCVDRIFGCVDAFVGLLQRAINSANATVAAASATDAGAIGGSNGGLLSLVSPGPGRDAMLALQERFSAESRMLVGLLHAHGASTSAPAGSSSSASSLSFGGVGTSRGAYDGYGGSASSSGGGAGLGFGTAQVSSALLMRLGFNGFFE